MNTYLNIGMNDAITASLSTKPNYGWTAWDCYRRLIQSWVWRMVSPGTNSTL
jgi:pyruvate,orthophosphate dikinase